MWYSICSENQRIFLKCRRPWFDSWVRKIPKEGTGYPLQCSRASLVAQVIKNLPAMWETWVRSLGWDDITLLTEVHIVKAMVFPVGIYGCERASPFLQSVCISLMLIWFFDWLSLFSWMDDWNPCLWSVWASRSVWPSFCKAMIVAIAHCIITDHRIISWYPSESLCSRYTPLYAPWRAKSALK